MLVIGAVLVLAAVGWGAKTALFAESNANLVTAPVVIGDIDQTVLASGALKPVSGHVGAQATGRVVSLKVTLRREGQGG